VYLDLGRLAQAETLYQATRSVEGMRAAALFGLGRVAMARGNPQLAAPLLEEALRLQPGATKIHYSLGMAHRALGDIAVARQHLAQYGEGKPQVADPMLDNLESMATGVRPLLFRAIDAVHAGHHEKAVELFQQALAKDPKNVNARVSLARSLYLTEQGVEARRQLEKALRRAPTHALANFFLGVWLHAAGERQAAVTHFKAALDADPQHSGAHHFLANIYMTTQDYPAAVGHYAKAVEKVPANLPARLMLAMAMLRAGLPQAEVRDSLERSLEAFPRQPIFGSPLARLLAASPDPGVRDGERALALAEALFEAENLLENAETLAMAYAETGRYREAEALQQNAFNAALAARRIGALGRLDANLSLYRAAKPCRQPFADNDPLFSPQPMEPGMVFREYPTTEAY
jgi:tetratricopeptide (TPR) repeat protein